MYENSENVPPKLVKNVQRDGDIEKIALLNEMIEEELSQKEILHRCDSSTGEHRRPAYTDSSKVEYYNQ